MRNNNEENSAPLIVETFFTGLVIGGIVSLAYFFLRGSKRSGKALYQMNIDELEDARKLAEETQNFERAAVIRDMLKKRNFKQ